MFIVRVHRLNTGKDDESDDNDDLINLSFQERPQLVMDME
jgi:hypothetical protein